MCPDYLLPISFSQISLIVNCYTFCKLEIKTSTPNTFKNQTSECFNLLGHNRNHRKGFVLQKVVALHCFGFKLKFPKRFYCDR